jgi:hypothetical protein
MEILGVLIHLVVSFEVPQILWVYNFLVYFLHIIALRLKVSLAQLAGAPLES